VTRQRLYYETMEEVLGNANKVLVDTKGTGNMIYLPLEKMMSARPPTPTLDQQRQTSSNPQPAQAAPAADEPTVESLRERGTR
jgi:membrane protease subunit HflK